MPKSINQLKPLTTFANQQVFLRRCSPSTFLILTLGLFLVFQSCGLDVEDPTPPSPPQWIPKSLPEEWPERGIDAYENGGIFVEWYPNPEDDIKGYYLKKARYYEESDSLGTFGLQQYIKNENQNPIQYLDEEAWGRVRYYYILEAISESDNLSQPSDTVYYSILPSIATEAMIPNGNDGTLGDSRKFKWRYYHGVEMEKFTLTILTESGDLIYRLEFSPTAYHGYDESWTIPDTVGLIHGTKYLWRIDMGARYQNGYEFVGAESGWARFLYADQDILAP